MLRFLFKSKFLGFVEAPVGVLFFFIAIYMQNDTNLIIGVMVIALSSIRFTKALARNFDSYWLHIEKYFVYRQTWHDPRLLSHS